MLKINMQYRSGRLIIEIIGYLNKFTSFKLKDYLVPVILKHEIKQVVYDTSNLLGIDRYGLKILKEGITAVNSVGGQIYYAKDSKIKIEG